MALGAGASKFVGLVEAFLEEYLVAENDLQAVPFGGRDDDLLQLDKWLEAADQAPRYLLTAPAGRGKSALLVRWIQRLQAQRRVGDEGSDAWQLVFFPISVRHETHRAEVFFEAIAARLAEILGEELPPTQTDKAIYYADHCRRLANLAIARKQRILLVLDGIDEAFGESFDARWFPRNPGPGLRLVLSARWQGDDEDSAGWVKRLGWDRDVKVFPCDLTIISLDGIRDVLVKLGAPIDVLAARPDIVQRLHELAEGEPLVLRYYAERIWEKGEEAPRLTLDDLASMQPGFGPFFERWLEDQQKLWEGAGRVFDREKVDAILAVLACAHGVLSDDDLKTLLVEIDRPAGGGRLLEHLKPVARFIIGARRRNRKTSGYVLSHPKLGSYLREEYFDRDHIAKVRTAFATWGRRIVSQLERGELQPHEAPAYLLQYHVQHLRDAAAPIQAFVELVE